MRHRSPRPPRSARQQQRTVIDRLRELTPFSTCTDRQLTVVSKHLCEHRAVTGDVLTEEGVRGRQFFVIAEGTAVVLVRGRQVATLGKGDFFGEVALLDWGTRSATVVAATDLVTMVCGVVDFDAILVEAPPVARRISAVLSRRLRLTDRLLDLSSTAVGGAR